MRFYKTSTGVIATSGEIPGAEEINKEEYEKAVSDTETRIETAVRTTEAVRPLSESEVLAMLIPQQINTLTVDDNTALRMLNFYPEWTAGVEYAVGFKVKHDGKLWRVIQAHTSQEGWKPGIVASLYEQINETHSGTVDDPIPYSGNMELKADLYYMQEWVIYLCTRNTIYPVHNTLADLVGLYVEKA